MMSRKPISIAVRLPWRASVIAAVAAAACLTLLTGASASAAGPHVTAGSGAAASGGVWGKAQEVPGTAVLNAGGRAMATSVSCPAAGNCTAGGFYTDGTHHVRAFTAGESKGVWGQAVEVLGSAAFNLGGAEMSAMSCAAVGSCSAGGFYLSSTNQQVFVVSESNGTWRKAQEVPGTAALNAGGSAEFSSISCASAGNCSAGGYYTSRVGPHGRPFTQAFVVGETNGVWGKAQEVPGTATLNTGGNAGLNSVSCASAGDCSAGGYYTTPAGWRAFVAGETNGVWGKAQPVPGLPAPSQAGVSEVESVSCAAAGNCSAGGDYPLQSGFDQPFVVNQTGGAWGRAQQVPGTVRLNRGGTAAVDSVSCASAGNCSAGGDYSGSNGNTHAFVVTETSGVWGKAEEVPGAASHNTVAAEVLSVSCAVAGSCSAGGYIEGTGGYEPFVVTETGGTWGTSEVVPGAASLNQGGLSYLYSVSCAAAGQCGAGGYYKDGNGATQAFVVIES